MIRVILCGIAGRMGREISALARESEDIEIVGGIEIAGHSSIGARLEQVPVHDDLSRVLSDADCIVEFTNPRATIDHMRLNKTGKKPFVTGTTGFSEDDVRVVRELAEVFPVFLAPNMSIGVNHLYELVNSSARVLAHYDIEVIETHHRMKKDAPSGTAREIVRRITGQQPGTKIRFGREGIVGERPVDEVCVHAVRGGDVVGEHRVVFLGNGEFVELRHYATSRRCFAAGTLDAVRFIVQQTHGLFSMEHMLAG